jgi:AraC family transcriptional regulator
VRVTYRYIPPLSVLYARRLGPYPSSAHAAWLAMNRWLELRQLRRQVIRGFGFLHDNPQCTPPELLRFDACVMVRTNVQADAEAGIGRQMLEGGTYAVHPHIGSYATAGRVLSDLHRDVVPKRGLLVDYDRPFIVAYLNDPLVTREVHRRTELCVPVLPIS